MASGWFFEMMALLSFRAITCIRENVANPLLGASGVSRRLFFLFTKELVSEATQEKAKARDDLTLVTAGEMLEAR